MTTTCQTCPDCLLEGVSKYNPNSHCACGCHDPYRRQHFAPAPVVVAECWTCMAQNHFGKLHGLGQRKCSCPSHPRRLTGKPLYVGDSNYTIEGHRALGHDVREVRS